MRRFITLACLTSLLTPIAAALGEPATSSPKLALVAAAAPPHQARALDGADLTRYVRDLEGDLGTLYRDLHQHPELSQHEEKTAAKLAGRLRQLGFQVVTGIGGHGVVGVLRNGAGPTLMLRAEMDGLPVREETGLPYASTATQRNDAGQVMPVMHACGHDLHMASWVGAATLMTRLRERWRGTLVMVGQPAEEKGDGARGMLRDGLLSRFPRPDFALAVHDSSELHAGTVGFTSGFALANVDSVDLTIYGKGGHGAYPHLTVDPVVLAARVVVGLQSIVAREKDPLEPAVITVGSIHGGTKHNVIPNEVRLQLTVRSYSDKVRAQLLSAIRRTVEAEAQAVQAPRPAMAVTEGTPATYNDPALTERISGVVRGVLGADKVLKTPQVMGGEDFSEYGRAGVPALIYWVGAMPAGSKLEGEQAPLHSSRFYPDYTPAIRTAVTSLVAASLDLLGK